MDVPILYTDNQITELYKRHADTVYRVCFTLLGNVEDAEDAMQNTFVKLITTESCFRSRRHEKAWLIITAKNVCRNYMRKKKAVPLNDWDPEDPQGEISIDETLEALLTLPAKYRFALYMYYYEGYSCYEIAKIMGKKESTVRSYLKRGRDLLKEKLGGAYNV